MENNIDLLVPDQRKRPSYYLELEKRNRPKQRVRTKAVRVGKFKWGDEDE